MQNYLLDVEQNTDRNHTPVLGLSCIHHIFTRLYRDMGQMGESSHGRVLTNILSEFHMTLTSK